MFLKKNWTLPPPTHNFKVFKPPQTMKLKMKKNENVNLMHKHFIQQNYQQLKTGAQGIWRNKINLQNVDLNTHVK